MTQSELAARLQVLGLPIDRGTIAKIEVQGRLVSDIELVALARALGVTTSWLLGDNG